VSLFSIFLCFFALIPTFLQAAVVTPDSTSSAIAIAAQTDPIKLSSLKGTRASNSRLQRCVYWLAYAEEQGQEPASVLETSAKINMTAGSPYAGFIRWGLLNNLKIAHELGLLTKDGMNEMRRGKSATITLGQFTGQEATVDHVIPLSVCPELNNQVLNLELLPASLNSSKKDKVGTRQVTFAKELNDAGLLSDEGFSRVKACFK
jgi:hypothetical protein